QGIAALAGLRRCDPEPFAGTRRHLVCLMHLWIFKEFDIFISLEETMNRRKLLIAGLLSLVLATSASAQQFPSQRVTIVVPYAPGGGFDIMIRAVAAELSAKWGQPVIIENKPGAGTL